MYIKPRRSRYHQTLRELLSETRLSTKDLVYPVFVKNGLTEAEPIDSMPGQFRHSPEGVSKVIEDCLKKGIKSFLFFGIAGEKDANASECYSAEGPVHKSIHIIRTSFPEALLMTDICVCGFTDHGHCALMQNEELLEDHTNDVLAHMAVSHVQAGAHIVAPSAMMDNQVKAIRKALDKKGYSDTGIMAYAAKYFSSFYGPFRDAAGSAPQFGNRAAYQMDPANRKEALKEMELDAKQGADILMVKPAIPYLDIIADARNNFNLPIAAYNVSGTYSMIKAAAEKGWINEDQVILELATSIRRAGANIIITYFAPQIADLLNQEA